MNTDCTTEFPLPAAYDLSRTLWCAGMGQRDPTLRVSAKQASLAFHTPTGPVTVLAVRQHSALRVQCTGDGQDWIQPHLHGLFGLDDRPQDFNPTGKISELVKRCPGAHLPTLPVVFHRLVQIVLQQLVSWNDALAGWRKIVAKFGDAAPSENLRLPPTAKQLSRLGYYDLVGCGVLPKQARLILQLAREAGRIERLAHAGAEPLEKYLLTIRGIGTWTVQHLLGTSCGCPDAVMTGDFGLPHTVAWYLAGKERSNDEEMLELLEPFAGHRFRVINLLMQNGTEAPRRGPRMRTNQWRFAR